MAQMVKRLSTMQKTWVQSLGREDSLEKKMATHSSIVVEVNPIDKGAWQATVHGVTKSQTQLTILLSFPLCTIGEIIRCNNHY